MTAKEVLEIYTRLTDKGVEVWIDGGWCVDALLQKQLRPHKDLDIAIESQHVAHLRKVSSVQGYTEVRADSEWNFILSNDSGQEIDVHVFVRDEEGNVVDGIMYPTDSLTGSGKIEGHTVKCIAPKYMVEFLAPWIHKWPEKYVPAVSALCEKYKLPLPIEKSSSG